MDEPPNTQGYNVILVNDDLKSIYQCPLCTFILKKPIQTERGERACSVCYQEAYDKDRGKCPIDKEPIDIERFTFLDRFLERQIAELDCYCNNKSQGCPWKGKLRDTSDHHSNCLYILTECEKCEESILKKDKKDHDENKCPERIVICEYCHETFTGRFLKLHNLKCLKYPLECPYGCHTSIVREELINHLLNDCKSLNSLQYCPYFIVGCTYNSKPSGKKRTDLLQHLTDDVHIHAGYLLQSYKSILKENEALNEQIAQFRNDFKKMKKPFPSVEKEIEKSKLLDERIKDFRKEFDDSIREHDKYLNEVKNILETVNQSGNVNKLSKLEDEITSLYTNYEEIVSMIDNGATRKTDYGDDDVENQMKMFLHQIEELESRNAILDSKVVEAKTQMERFEETSYDGEMVWRIPNMMLKLSELKKGKTVTAMHSPICYSKKGGYKFCSRLYLSGDGIGKGSHISLFIVIMRTGYDVLLKWPFQERVSFELIHPYNKSFNVKESFIPDPNSSSFQQPTREMNIAAGCPLFLKKDDLLNKGFIADDCVYVRTTVGKNF